MLSIFCITGMWFGLDEQ